MTVLVHIAPENRASAIRRNGIAPRRWSFGRERPHHDRVVWAFPVLPSYTLTHSWSRELKRRGATTLVAVTFRLGDDEEVYARHFSSLPLPMSAAEAVGFIRERSDPRGYEVMIPRRIQAKEIVRISVLPKATGWRYSPTAKNAGLMLCDCWICSPRGEVKAGRYRRMIAARMKTAGLASRQAD